MNCNRFGSTVFRWSPAHLFEAIPFVRPPEHRNIEQVISCRSRQTRFSQQTETEQSHDTKNYGGFLPGGLEESPAGRQTM